MNLDFTGYEAIPEITQYSLINYLKGYQPGHFLTAVLSNNLFEAMNRADSKNQDALPLIVKFIYNRFPSDSYGSIEHVEEWLSKEH